MMYLLGSWFEDDGVSVSICSGFLSFPVSLPVSPGDEERAGCPKSAESKLAQPLLLSLVWSSTTSGSLVAAPHAIIFVCYNL